MAKTFRTEGLVAIDPNSSHLSYMLRDHEEGATETFVGDSPLVMTSGYLVEAADPVTTCFGFAAEAGSNTSSAGDTRVRYLPAYHGLLLFVNFLDAAGGDDNVLAQTDFGSDFELQKDAVGVGGATVWHGADVGTSASITIVGGKADITVQGVENGNIPEAGDTNARVGCILLDSVRTWK